MTLSTVSTAKPNTPAATLDVNPDTGTVFQLWGVRNRGGEHQESWLVDAYPTQAIADGFLTGNLNRNTEGDFYYVQEVSPETHEADLKDKNIKRLPKDPTPHSHTSHSHTSKVTK